MTQTILAAAVLLASGRATRYDPDVMQPVVANRIRWHQIDPNVEHKGYVALLDFTDVGRLVWLEHDGRIDGPYMVADCASLQDQARLKRLGWAVDLSWEVAVDWGVVDGPLGGFRVWDRDPREGRTGQRTEAK
jgi:hypothetical protein